jgi:4-hydroxy-tetrahydrodipicolinate synthase
MGRFGRVITAMVTPFDDGGRLDLDATAALARWLVANGTDGLVVTGTTGEVSVLTDDEHLDVWRAVRAAVDVPVLGGSGSNDTRHAIELTAEASGIGLDGVLVVTPYYNRPPQSGLDAHFRAVAAATDLPVMLYDIPVRSGRKVASELLVRLANEVPNIVALKDAAGNPAETARVMAEVPDDFELYSGDDALTLPLLALGAAGVVSVCSHWAGEEMAAMVDAFASGDTSTARRHNDRLLDSYAYEGSDAAPNPIPAKVILGVLGQHVGDCRLPLGPPPAGLADDARRVLANLGRAPDGNHHKGSST